MAGHVRGPAGAWFRGGWTDGERSIGALVVVQAADLHEARNVVNTDPYVAGGVFERIIIHPFKQVVPEP